MPIFNSSAVKRAEYDPDTRILKIWFAGSGGPYDYFDVPQNVFDELCQAPSKGRYVNEHIRDLYSTERRAGRETRDRAPGPPPPSLMSRLRDSIGPSEGAANGPSQGPPFPRRPLPRR